MIIVCSSKGPQTIDFVAESDWDKDLSALNLSLSKKNIVFDFFSLFEGPRKLANALCREPDVAIYRPSKI